MQCGNKCFLFDWKIFVHWPPNIANKQVINCFFSPAVNQSSSVWLSVFVSIRSGWMRGVEESAALTPTFWSMTSAAWRALSMSRWSDSKLWIIGMTELIRKLKLPTSKNNREWLSCYSRSNKKTFLLLLLEWDQLWSLKPCFTQLSSTSAQINVNVSAAVTNYWLVLMFLITVGPCFPSWCWDNKVTFENTVEWQLQGIDTVTIHYSW